jgi:hypothetical protein
MEQKAPEKKILQQQQKQLIALQTNQIRSIVKPSLFFLYSWKNFNALNNLSFFSFVLT